MVYVQRMFNVVIDAEDNTWKIESDRVLYFYTNLMMRYKTLSVYPISGEVSLACFIQLD